VVQLSAIAGLVLKFDVINYQEVNQSISSSQIMSSHQGVQFNDPPVTDHNSMDVDDTSGSLISQGMSHFLCLSFLTGHASDDLYLGPDDDLYLGPDDDLEDDSVSSSHPDMFDAIPGEHLTYHSSCMSTKPFQINFLQLRLMISTFCPSTKTCTWGWTMI
jgi:hypothetical protein